MRAAKGCLEFPPFGFVGVVGGALLALALGELCVVQRVVGSGAVGRCLAGLALVEKLQGA